MPEVIVYKSKEFKVVLDTQTGRPHLVMLYNGKKKYKTIYDFEPFIYKRFIEFVDRILWDLGPAIFSIHLGKYQSKDSPHFHAHFFIPITIYVSMAVANNANININFDEWQSKAIKDGATYKHNDLKNIYKLVPFPKSKPTLPLGYEIIFHSKLPRIGFYNPDKEEILSEIIHAMMFLINYYGLNSRDKGGSHLVIQNGIFLDEEFKYYMGYIQVDIQNYYKINPHRKQWLKEFKKVPYAVLT